MDILFLPPMGGRCHACGRRIKDDMASFTLPDGSFVNTHPECFSEALDAANATPHPDEDEPRKTEEGS